MHNRHGYILRAESAVNRYALVDTRSENHFCHTYMYGGSLYLFGVVLAPFHRPMERTLVATLFIGITSLLGDLFSFCHQYVRTNQSYSIYIITDNKHNRDVVYVRNKQVYQSAKTIVRHAANGRNVFYLHSVPAYIDVQADFLFVYQDIPFRSSLDRMPTYDIHDSELMALDYIYNRKYYIVSDHCVYQP